MNVLLVDDHPLFCSGMKNLLEAGGITVVGIARDGSAALAAARELKPDLILMDITMPDCDGLTATRLIKSEFPEIRIVMLTMNEDDASLLEAIRSGASGYLLKFIEPEQLFECLEQLAKGETVFSPGLARRIGQALDTAKAGQQPENRPLTLRQEEVLGYIARGLTYRDVAALLSISEITVRYHLKEILERLHLENRAQAIAYITEAKLAKSPKPR